MRKRLKSPRKFTDEVDEASHVKDDEHVSDMDHTKLKCPPFPKADEDKMINSTRIRVGRNLDGYPLGPGISKEQRDEVMAKVKEAAETFEDDLKGTFYPLEGMDKATQDQLIADHVLFKEGDRFLDACGLDSERPAARGIFHNGATTFLLWANEEDQLRIISMQFLGRRGQSEHFNVIDYKKDVKRIIISGTDEAEKEAGKGLQFGAKASVSVVATIEGKQKARSSCMRSHEGKVGGSETGRRQKDEDDEAQSEVD